MSAVVDFDDEGDTPDIASTEDRALVRDGLELLAAFRSIADEDVRRSLVTLVGSLAKSPGE